MKIKVLTFALALVAGAVIAAVALREEEGNKFESIIIGDSEAEVYELLGVPSAVNEFGQFKDLRYWITYTKKKGYSLLGTSMGYPRIIRIKDGKVASKGMNEAYYDPHKPGWVPIAQPANQAGDDNSE